MQEPKEGWAVIPADDVKVGDELIADGEFTCLKDHEHVHVEQDHDGLFVRCAEGRHGLDGQLDDDRYVGFWKAKS